MSLKLKFLAGVTGFMTLIVGLVTLNLLLDAHQRRMAQSEAVRVLTEDWARSIRELREARSDSSWLPVEARLEGQSLVKGWKIAGFPGGEPTVLSAKNAERVLSERDLQYIERARRSGRAQVTGPLVYVPFQANNGELFVGRFELAHPLTLAEDPAQPIREILLLMAAATALVLIVIYIFLERYVMRPLGTLLEGARRIAMGDLNRPVPLPPFYDEMRQLVEAFNSMMERLRQQAQTLREEARRQRERATHTERKLLVAQRLSATGTLAAGVAHEINNPLGGMINAAKALQEGNLDEVKSRQYVALIIDGLDRIRHIVGQILRMAPRPAVADRADAREAVEGAVALMGFRVRQKGVEVTVESDEPPVWVRADPAELQQALLNVLINAVDAVEPGSGRVRVEVRRSREGVRISTADNGVGMDETELARCLDPFYTTKPVGEGTGLGLPVAHGIVMRSGGDMYIETLKGHGTTITFVLPSADGQPPQNAPLHPEG